MRRHRVNRAQLVSSAVALAVSGFACHARAANLLLNGSFESPTDNSGNNTDTTATGWTFYGSDVRAEFANDPAFGGQWGIWHQTFAPGGVSFGGIFQNDAVPAAGIGTTYTLTAYQYFESAAPTVPGLVSDLALTWLNASNAVVGTTDANGYSDATYTPAASQPTNAWTQYTVTGVAPVGATQVQVSFDFVNGSTVTGAQGIFVDEGDLEGVGTPHNVAQWASNGSGDWNQSGNWTTGSVPNGTGSEADFVTSPGITSNSTAYTNVPIVEATIKFDNPNVCEIAGTGNLTIQNNPATSGLVNVNQGTDILDLPITVASNTTFNVNTGATLIVGNPITINSGLTLSQTGAGTVNYESIITVQSNAAVEFGSSSHAHELNVASNGTASLNSPNGTVVLEVDSLSNAGTVNVANNELVVNYGSGADPIATIKSQLVTGFNHGTWNGPGINSSSAASRAGTYGLGYADSADPGNPAGLASGTIEVKYTLLGDANLSGVVDGTDFGILAANFNKGVSRWDQGDFNYDNVVDGTDFGFLAANFNKGANGAAIGEPAYDDPAILAFAAANGLLADVPEPASLGLLAAGVAAALARRRRRS